MATATKKRTTTAREVRDAAQVQVNKIIAKLEEGAVPWHKEWHCATGDMPTSLATGKLYRGSNVISLWIAMLENGWSSNYFGTYNQMAERAGMVATVVGKYNDGNDRIKYLSPRLEDGSIDPTPRGVRKGETSTEIIKWLFFDKKVVDENGKPVLRKDGRPAMKRIAVPRIFHVFNADQCEFPEGCKGVPATPVRGEDFDPIVEAEEILKHYLEGEGAPSLRHGGDRAFYKPVTDHIQMPKKADFTSKEAYYSTLYHECGHSTGHDSRLKREGIAKGTFGAFGDKLYSFEELVAELTASFLTAIVGIEQAAILDNSAAYIQHWLGQLREDKNLIIRAASQAQKAVDCILGTTFENKDEEEEVAAE
jgi:antirestriction protein ArdC